MKTGIRFFTKNGYHTGLVYAVDGTYFYTVEGNTSGGPSVVANGSGVAKKKYNISTYRGKVLLGQSKPGKTMNQIDREVVAGKWYRQEEKAGSCCL